MVSVNYTASNAAALSSLRLINSQLQTTQNHIATGYKVASAKDNASVWAAATSVRSEISKGQAIIDGLGKPQSAADAAAEGLGTVSAVLGEIASLVGTMTASGTATNAQKLQLTGLQAKVTAAITGSASGTVNLLTSTTATSANIGFQADGTLIAASYAANAITGGTGVTAVMAASPDLADATKIATYAAAVVTAQTEITEAAAKVSNFSSVLTMSADFGAKLNDIREAGLSKLVDADMEKESALVSALQVKQQLAYQALSIGNASSQNILRLFQ